MESAFTYQILDEIIEMLDEKRIKINVGEHILYWGDCLEVMQSFEKESIDLIVTDPPYSLGYEFDNDSLSYDKQQEFMDLYCSQFFRILNLYGTICIFMSQEMSHYLYFVLKRNGFTWQNEVIWNRDGGQMPIKKLGICH